MESGRQDEHVDTTTSSAPPSKLLNARRLYKYSTAVLVDWLAANEGIKAGKTGAGVKAGSKRPIIHPFVSTPTHLLNPIH